jgi:hypothetical protein
MGRRQEWPQASSHLGGAGQGQGTRS